MNRKDEYNEWLAELEQTVPALDGTLTRAQKRRRRKKIILGPILSVAAVFALFVVAVNSSVKVAYACSQIPILKELAEAVTFSRSLTDAVENEYVQPMNLTQEEDGVTVSVEYLIVDQKQVNVFFRIASEEEKEYNVSPTVLTRDKKSAGCAYGLKNHDAKNGELRSMTIDFLDEDVPDGLVVKFDVSERGAGRVGVFEFLLEFDPQFTAVGKVYEINKTVLLDGNEIIIRRMEVYPTHLRVNIEETTENKDKLKGLEFYIKTDWGMQFETVSNGIIAHGSVDAPEITSYRADSTYFYEADHLEIVITGADWLDKSREMVYVNLLTGETKGLPEHVKFGKAEKLGGGWAVTFDVKIKEEDHFDQNFAWSYYDVEGNEYDMNARSHMYKDSMDEDYEEYYEEIVHLSEYPYNEAWLKLQYTHSWEAEEPVAILVQE